MPQYQWLTNYRAENGHPYTGADQRTIEYLDTVRFALGGDSALVCRLASDAMRTMFQAQHYELYHPLLSAYFDGCEQRGQYIDPLRILGWSYPRTQSRLAQMPLNSLSRYNRAKRAVEAALDTPTLRVAAYRYLIAISLVPGAMHRVKTLPTYKKLEAASKIE